MLEFLESILSVIMSRVEEDRMTGGRDVLQQVSREEMRYASPHQLHRRQPARVAKTNPATAVVHAYFETTRHDGDYRTLRQSDIPPRRLR